MSPALEAEYVLPLRWRTTRDDDPAVLELAEYLQTLTLLLDVTVVDGSDDTAFGLHHRAWADAARHVRPLPRAGRNGKVAGVVTGVTTARHERVVIADDDVRYDAVGLAQVLAALDGPPDADLVRPQNHFVPLPWHARWDTARSLLNRAFGRDHPGTFAVRRSTFVAMGGYDGEALFENLELSRTVQAAGGVERHVPGVFVRRLPPSTQHFWAQRVRQAYDDLAQPGRLVAELAVLPGAVLLAVSGRAHWLAAVAAAVVAAAEVGRRRAGGQAVFSPDAALWAVPWLAERAVCVWLALAWRVRGGVPYCGARMPLAAHSVAALRRERDLGPGRRSARTARLAA